MNTVCPDCGGKKKAESKRCKACYDVWLEKTTDERHAKLYAEGYDKVKYRGYPRESLVCPLCDGPKSPTAKKCAACDRPRRSQMAKQNWANANYKRQRYNHSCPKCSGYKDGRSQCCAKCYQKQRAINHRNFMKLVRGAA